MFMPHEKGNSPSRSGRIATVVFAWAGRARRMPKSGSTISSLQGLDSRRSKVSRSGHAAAGDDQVRGVAAFDHDRDVGARDDGGGPLSEEKDEEKDDQRRSDADRGDAIRRHASLLRARRRLLVTTEIEEAAIAADAIIGESIQPVRG